MRKGIWNFRFLSFRGMQVDVSWHICLYVQQRTEHLLVLNWRGEVHAPRSQKTGAMSQIVVLAQTCGQKCPPHLV